MGYQKLLDPNGAKQKQFDRIIDFLAKTPRPKTDYRWLSHVDFLSLHYLRRIFDIQTSYMLLLRISAAMYRRGYMAEPMARNGYLSLPEILRWSRCIGTRELYEIYCYTYPDSGLIGLLADLKLEESFLDNEFAARVVDKPFTSELILVDWGGLDRKKEVEKLLEVDKIKSRRKWEQSADDIKQSAWAKTIELWRKPGLEFWRPGSVSDTEFSTPLPVFPGAPVVRMIPPEKEFWEGPMARAWSAGKMAYLRGRVPILSGEKEPIPENVRDHRRNEWETIARRNLIRKGKERFPKKGPESWRAHWDFSKTAAEGRRKEIDLKVHALISSPEDYAIEAEDLREKELLESRSYKIAMKRAGKKGTIYLDGLKAGKTNMAAAQAAGISRRTGERIKEVIRQSLPSETLKKTRR